MPTVVGTEHASGCCNCCHYVHLHAHSRSGERCWVVRRHMDVSSVHQSRRLQYVSYDKHPMGGVHCGRGETVGLSSKFWDSYNASTSRFIFSETGFGFGRDWGCAFAHAPPLQEFGDMLTRSIRNRIQSRDGKRICACWCIALVACVCGVCVSSRARRGYQCMGYRPACAAT